MEIIEMRDRFEMKVSEASARYVLDEGCCQLEAS